MRTTLTSKGQVTIPQSMRQHFGLRQGMAIVFEIDGDHIALRPSPSTESVGGSGFGLIRSRRKSVPADFDVATLVKDAS